MNYIRQLQTEVAAAKAEISAKKEAVEGFRIHLASENFAGWEADGSRKDWIATADVYGWLSRILEAGADILA